MADILCLDTEQRTVAALQAAGHSVLSAPFGYRSGMRYLHRPPQEFDLVVCDMQAAACFDVRRWGPYGGNDNYKCTIVPESDLNWETRLIASSPTSTPKKQYIYKLIQETQIEHMCGPSPYGPDDVRQAIAVGAVPALIFLNPEWVLRTGFYEFPLFVGLTWRTKEADTTKFLIAEPLRSRTTSWNPPLTIASPVPCGLASDPEIPARVQQQGFLEATSIVTDRVGTTLGQFVRCGNGEVWLLPAAADNAVVAVAFANTLGWEPAASSAGPPAPTATPSASVSATHQWDLFISHASEDKGYTDELYKALTNQGVKVWYDTSILMMGDSLLHKINEGLLKVQITGAKQADFAGAQSVTIGDEEDRLITFVFAQLVEQPTRFVLAEEFDGVGLRPGHRPDSMLKRTLLSNNAGRRAPSPARSRGQIRPRNSL